MTVRGGKYPFLIAGIVPDRNAEKAGLKSKDRILKINKDNGNVVAEVDASNLLTREQRSSLNREAVLNGIAYDVDKESFLITGKLWPSLPPP